MDTTLNNDFKANEFIKFNVRKNVSLDSMNVSTENLTDKEQSIAIQQEREPIKSRSFTNRKYDPSNDFMSIM